METITSEKHGCKDSILKLLTMQMDQQDYLDTEGTSKKKKKRDILKKDLTVVNCNVQGELWGAGGLVTKSCPSVVIPRTVDTKSEDNTVGTYIYVNIYVCIFFQKFN